MPSIGLHITGPQLLLYHVPEISSWTALRSNEAGVLLKTHANQFVLCQHLRSSAQVLPPPLSGINYTLARKIMLGKVDLKSVA